MARVIQTNIESPKHILTIVKLDDYETFFNQSFICEMSEKFNLVNPGRYYEIENIEQKIVSDSILEAYYGKSRVLTDWQRNAIKKILTFYKDENSEYHKTKKDSLGIYFTDPFLLIGNLQQVNEDLNPIGINVTKLIGRRYYFEKLN